jgi:hypothetical protein
MRHDMFRFIEGVIRTAGDLSVAVDETLRREHTSAASYFDTVADNSVDLIRADLSRKRCGYFEFKIIMASTNRMRSRLYLGTAFIQGGSCEFMFSCNTRFGEINESIKIIEVEKPSICNSLNFIF